MTPKELIRYFDFSVAAHTDHPRRAANAVRLADGKTPYVIHPLWCALTILTEHALPEEVRFRGAKALALHDVLEDTNERLPYWVEEDVRRFVELMTFESFGEEVRCLFERAPAEIRLLKLYDKVSNLLDGTWMSAEKRRAYEDFTFRLVRSAERHYGDLNITRMARGILGRPTREGGRQ